MSPHSHADTTTPPAPVPPPGSRTAEGTHLMHRSLKVEPAMVESASRLTLHLSDGRAVLDACGGAAVAIIGHGNDEVAKAMARQAARVSYVHTQSYTTPAAEDLANFLLEGSPHGLEKAFFVCSGSEAVEAALKLARQYFYEKGETQRVHFVSRKQSYHGNTMGSLSVSSNLARKVPYQDFGYQHVSHVSPAYAYRYKRDGETMEDFTTRLLEELETEFLSVGPSRVIAFIAEPVGGATAGCLPPPPGYLRGVRALCDKYGILLILDEIMCGTGRCGTYFAFEQEDGVTPDLVTVAKGLGGGYCSIAAVLAHKRVVDVLRRGTSSFNHGHTYQAHPIACATALAVQTIVRRDGLVARCAAMGRLLEAKLRAALAGCPSVGDVRGRGLFWAVEFVRDRETKETFDPAVTFGIKVQQTAFEGGVAIYPGWTTVDGTKGDHILLAPPFTVTEEELDTIVRVLKEAITTQERIHM
ncbi:Aminotransferase class-III [Cordyceps fumosorosea ARSEF 2679]|uniref:Aminotransferase class-III n=1 Tax=Cordyceps fumosorosea (strain ARSEF 2679) TaxID=1081104 RepID=A0A168ARP4_CORFA|nr:Aminotransferase class-III [Cordyceps fumosorosea ARSEF 2679]OAA69105.1 Aminotransferase class-III [Cordyceps fumosorosea ARSEF 2679]